MAKYSGLKNVIFAPNKSKAKEYVKKTGLGSLVILNKKQVKHIAGWKTYRYK